MKACAHFPRCAGCQTLSTPYPAQLAAKQDSLAQVLAPWADRLLPPIGSETLHGFRHKVQLPVQQHGRRVDIGIYAEGTHRVVDQLDCLVQPDDANLLVQSVRAWIEAADFPVHDEVKKTPGLWQVLVRRSRHQGKMLLGLVGRALPSHYLKPLADSLQAYLLSSLGADWMARRVAGAVLLVNDKPGNGVLHGEPRLLWGVDHVVERIPGMPPREAREASEGIAAVAARPAIPGVEFRIGIETFFQVHPGQIPALLEAIRAPLRPEDKLLDLYCGVGMIGLGCASLVSQVTGLESVAASVREAEANATRNNIASARFRQADLEKLEGASVFACLPELAESTVVVADPPRKGLSERLRQLLNETEGPDRLCLVSCEPTSLARDLAALQERWEVVSIQGIDLFPHTRHIETVAQLVRRRG